MAASSLLALIDDIATILDDVAMMTKVASKKTAGIVGDDIALNAEQVTGVNAERELHVIWAVAKGSLLNKVILVPAALLISFLLPILVTILLMIGGAFLCFEGFEKVFHKLLHSKEEREAHHAQMVEALADPNVDLVAAEKQKIKGAIRTDFILSAEIVVITLGAVADATMAMRIAVVCSIAFGITIGVYGLVAGIVKLDDAGLALTKRGGGAALLGRGLLVGAPILMKILSIAGTTAMFLVGGGILSHNIPPIHHAAQALERSASATSGVLGFLVSMLFEGFIGIILGGAVVAVVTGVKKLLPKKAKSEPATQIASKESAETSSAPPHESSKT